MATIPRLRPLLRAPLLRRFHAISLHASAAREIPYLPKVLQPSTYRPNFSKEASAPTKSRFKAAQGYNPATFFIWIFLLIGSQAIHQILLKHEHADFMRKADSRIAALREVIERLGRGEDVDVEAMLGTGDEKAEKDWEQVLKEIEEDDVLWQARKLQKEAAEKHAEEQRLAEEQAAAEEEEERRRKRRAAAAEARFL